MDSKDRKELREQKRHNRRVEAVQKKTARDQKTLSRELAQQARREADAQAFRESGEHLRRPYDAADPERPPE